MLNRLLRNSTLKADARKAYGAIVAAARHPALYTTCGVADTIDGRFEMIVLHGFLVMDRLLGHGANAQNLGQALADEIFADMDRSLREMGVGDVTVPKKVRKMAEAYYGRVAAYNAALADSNPQRLIDALNRNVFPDQPHEASATKLAAYVRQVGAALASQAIGPLCQGEISFPEPMP